MSTRESGMALLGVLLAMVVLLSVIAASVSLSVSDLQAVQNGRDQLSAFYLAEGGLQRAKCEIGEGEDFSGYGVGNDKVDNEFGSIRVTAVETDPNVFRLTSTGATATESVTLVETVLLTQIPISPGGAISIGGGVGIVEFLTSDETDLILDGGPGSPAIVFGDSDFHGDFVTQLDDAISDGYVDSVDITGGGLEGSDAIVHDPTAVADMSTFYTDIQSHIADTLIPGADSVSLPGSSVTYGSEGSPVNNYFANVSTITSGQTVTGHGTLVFSNQLVIENGGVLNWVGDVIVFGDSITDADLNVDGTLNVTGNLIVLSQDERDARFLIARHGDVDVVGAVTLLTNLADPATKLQFLVENNFDVEGIVTVGAGIHQIEFKRGSDSFIRGMLQVVMTSGNKYTLKVEDDLEIVRDTDLVQGGIDIVEGVNGTVIVGGSRMSVGGDISSYGWSIFHNLD